MRLKQGTFSHLPDLTDDEIAAQVRYALSNGWPVSVEYTDDPHPRNVYWEMYGLPLFDLNEPDGVVAHINECRATFPGHYVRVQAYDPTLDRQSTMLQFIAQRPAEEPGFSLTRGEGPGRTQRYTVKSYATDKPVGSRYQGE